MFQHADKAFQSFWRWYDDGTAIGIKENDKFDISAILNKIKEEDEKKAEVWCYLLFIHIMEDFWKQVISILFFVYEEAKAAEDATAAKKTQARRPVNPFAACYFYTFNFILKSNMK